MGDFATSAISAISGIVGFSVGFLLNWLKDHTITERQRKNEGRFIAIQLGCIFDNYVADCYKIAKESVDDIEHHQNGEVYFLTSNPELAPFPSNSKYQNLDGDILHEAFGFPSFVSRMKEELAEQEQFSVPPNHEVYYNARRKTYAMTGLAACGIIDKIKSKYNLSVFPTDVYSPKKWFQVVIKSGGEML